jgi:hypothetical protein
MKLNLKAVAVTASVACSVSTFSISPASAAVIYDNLGFPSTFSDSVRSVNPNNGQTTDGPLADSFSTGSYIFTLTDVQVRVQRESSNTTPERSVTVSLLSDSGSNSPGSLLSILGTFTDGQLSSTPTIIDLPQAIGIVLEPLTRYWIMLSTADNSRAGWAAAGGTGSGSTYGTAPDQWGVGTEGEYFYAGGALALGYPTNVFQNGASPYLPYQMQVSGDIPEPASLAVFALGLGALGLVRRARSVVQNSFG